MRKSVIVPDGSVNGVDIYLDRGRMGMVWAGDTRRAHARVFQRDKDTIFFGLAEYLAAIRQMINNIDPSLASQVIIHAKPEGSVLDGARDTVITIEGPQVVITMFETFSKYLHLGTHFRTNAWLFTQVAPGKIMFFGARYISDQTVAIAAAAMAEEGIRGSVPKYGLALGTMSHAQGIAAIDPDSLVGYSEANTGHILQGLSDAAIRFHCGNPSVPVVILVDHLPRSLGCPETAVKAVRKIEGVGIKVDGIRLDLGKTDLDGFGLVDKSLGGIRKRGMHPDLVRNTRRALNQAGYKHIKIVVSSGITLDTIRKWERARVPVDLYGIGTALIGHKWLERIFTFDLVAIEDADGNMVPAAKEGRELRRIYDSEQLARLRTTPSCRISNDLVRVF